MKAFSKPALDVPSQLKLLQQRGLHIKNRERALLFLEAVSFFRLTPYMRPFQDMQDPQHHFRPDTGFRQLVQLYDFDRRLRLLVMDAIERIEVAVRAAISNHMGPTQGSHWYLDPQLFASAYDHQRLLDTVNQKQERATRDFHRECQRIERITDSQRKVLLKAQRSRESYVRYYPLTYREPTLMPGWAMLEELTLGELSHLYAGLARDADRKAIARRLQLVAPLLESWLHTLTTIRNICAHHARLWNRELGVSPEFPKKARFPWPQYLQSGAQHRRLFPILCILSHLMRQVSPDTSWDSRLQHLIQQFPSVDLPAMGFAPQWQEDAFWAESIDRCDIGF